MVDGNKPTRVGLSAGIRKITDDDIHSYMLHANRPIILRFSISYPKDKRLPKIPIVDAGAHYRASANVRVQQVKSQHSHDKNILSIRMPITPKYEILYIFGR